MTSGVAPGQRRQEETSIAHRRELGRGFPFATYRLQFNSQFTFQRALEVADYLHKLGISDCYASPLLKATPQSLHGYDVCDFERLRTELGSDKDFEAWSNRLRQLGMGLVLDIVPNHMAADFSNSMFQDVLANGPDSPFASWFDIRWERGGRKSAKILLPVLEDHYRSVLESGKLQIANENGTWLLRHGEQRIPLSPASLQRFRRQLENRLDVLNGQIGDPDSFDLLDELIRSQHYRLAYWRVGLEELNYRRFFDVTSLVGLRMELLEVFEVAHALIFKWAREGRITGLRVDHPDGLWNPKQYFERLWHALRKANSPNVKHAQQPYVVAEKILSDDEPLPGDWPIDGTTGYDFLNQVNGLFVDPANHDALDALYHKFTGCAPDFSAVVDSSKRLVLHTIFRSEWDALAQQLKSLALNTRFGADFTLSQLRSALGEVLIAFPVYRTYITERTAPTMRGGKTCREATAFRAVERQWLQQALAGARTASPTLAPRVFDWLEAVLLLEPLESSGVPSEQERLDFVMRFQQLTGPLMAKGLEDTAFYRFNRLLSLNEVGGNPGRFGVSIEGFHALNASRLEQWPHSLLATATHDTKYGEDARARLDVLSEMPAEWGEAVQRWQDMNAAHRTMVAGEPAPHPNDEYLLYQALVGAWVPQAESARGSEGFSQRISAFMLKAIREAKARTSWLDPNPAYEEAVGRFVAAILSKSRSNHFPSDFQNFQRRVSFFGEFNSLSQTLLKLTCPGIPDFYQGTELWDFNLVDPDNRRPVDFDLRRRLLSGITQEVWAARGTPGPLLERLLRKSASGEIKLFLIWRALNFRATYRELFDYGRYRPLTANGTRQKHVCAFSRTWRSQEVLVVAPRLVFGLAGGIERAPLAEVWEDTSLELPGQSADQFYRNVFTGQLLQTKRSVLSLRDLLQKFPAGMFEKVIAGRLHRNQASSFEHKAPEGWRSPRRYRANRPQKTLHSFGRRRRRLTGKRDAHPM